MKRFKTHYDYQHTDPECLEAIMHFITAPDSESKQFTSTPLKYDKKASVIKLTFQNKSYIIKHYHRRNFFHYLRKTRAKNSWYFAKKLNQHAINTPRPLVIIEKKLGAFKIESYFVSEVVPGEWCYHVMRSTEISYERKKTISDKIKIILSSLDALGLVHGDMKASNILIHQDTPYLIDLDGMHTKRPLLDHKKDHKRFMNNWTDQIITEFFS